MGLKRYLLFAGLVACCPIAQAKPEYAGDLPSREVTVRDGIGHVLEKIRSGQEVRVAYFGGSITAMDGWRRLSCEWLRQRFPAVRFTEISASIGGTGSGLGVYRFRQDVLAKGPDLVFVEFATNDRKEPPETIWRNFDGIVLQAWRKNPNIDFVFVYTVVEAMMDSYGEGRFNRSASAMEMLAEHYGIPSVGFGPRVTGLFKAGKLKMSSNEVAEPMPEAASSAKRTTETGLSEQGPVLFSKDGVHPAPSGHRLYLESFKEAFGALVRSKSPPRERRQVGPYFDAALAAAKLVPIAAQMCRGRSWRQQPADGEFSWLMDRMGVIWEANEPGDALEFSFKGSFCGLYDILCPAGCRVWITVDGKRRQKAVDRFDEFCRSSRPAGFRVYAGEEGVHSVRVEIDRQQPDRTAVLRRFPEENVKSAKYFGTRLLVSQIELTGEIVSAEADSKGAIKDDRRTTTEGESAIDHTP